MVAAVSRVQAVSCSTKSVATGRLGRSARHAQKNFIDGFTRTTAGAVEKWAAPQEGAGHHQPAEPPMMMRDTTA
jgi:acetaldehyde dehydrogenase (acetylating)